MRGAVVGLLVVGFWLTQCGAEETSAPEVTTTSETTSTGGGGGAGGVGGGGAGGIGPDFCAERGLASRELDTSAPFGSKRHDTADDFTLPLFDGTSWRLSEHWTGCDSYVFLTSARTKSALDDSSLWLQDLDALVEKSALNTHYFFVAARGQGEAMQELADMQGRVDALLPALEPALAEHWKQRLLVVGVHYSAVEGWPKNLLAGDGRGGFAIDRRQRVRLLGNFADVKRYQAELANANQWPWESNLAYAAYEVRWYNFEAERDAKLEADGATVVTVVDGEVMKEEVEIDATFPDAATMATFDTLQIDLTMDCPDPDGPEFGNCGAWDYLSHIRLWDEANQTWLELARFVTTYHREGRYLVDATPMLVLLKDGGMQKLRFDVSPPWNPQAYLTRMDFRFSNQEKGYRPTEATYLYGGGSFNSKYNDAFQPIDVPIPAGAKHVELWAVITGHGGDTFNCAEFCRHQHEFSVNGKAYLKDHPTVGKNEGCVDQIDHGMTPNQGGTWWFGRGGWCPGQQVDPWVVDVTADVTPGQNATVSYQGLYKGKTPPDNAGNIVMTSYLVVYQ